MGLKSGSRDAGLDDADDETEESAREEEQTDDDVDRDEGRRERGDAVEPSDGTDGTTESTGRDGKSDRTDHDATATGQQTTAEPATGRASGGSIPYKLRRDKVNDGREQVPYFLREAVIDAEDDLQDALEAMLGEDVYKSDYREASMVVAQRNPELVAEVLREWGYDFDFD